MLAQLAPFYNLTLLSYSAGNSDLSNRSLYPYFVRTASSLKNMIPFVYDVVFKHFNYTACYIVHNISEYSNDYAKKLSEYITNGGGESENTAKLVVVGNDGWQSTNDADQILNKLEQLSIRVVIHTFEGTNDLPAYWFCQAWRRGMLRQPKSPYFFLVDAAVDAWRTVMDVKFVGCTQTELNEALEGVLQVGVLAEQQLPDNLIKQNINKSRGELKIEMVSENSF